MTIPYTYHLYHKPTGTHYYGARYRKGCSPDDLWNTYFSSSAVVKALINEYGKDSFVATVRKTFKTRDAAVAWEAKVHQRLNVQESSHWLNRHNSRAKFIGPHVHSAAARKKISAKSAQKVVSESTKEKMRIAAQKRESTRRAEGWSMPNEAVQRAIDTRKARIAAGEIDPYNASRNAKMAKSKKGTKRHYSPNGSFIMVKPTSTPPN